MPRTFHVSASTPPTFLVHADDDRLAPSANSVPFYLELKKFKVPAELHVYANGGHGFGILKTDKTSAAWPQALSAWLAMIK
jgi:acetyl esterase/lipase